MKEDEEEQLKTILDISDMKLFKRILKSVEILIQAFFDINLEENENNSNKH